MTDLTGNPATLDLTRAPFTPLTPVSDTVMNAELQQLLDNDAFLAAAVEALRSTLTGTTGPHTHAITDVLGLRAELDGLNARVLYLEQHGGTGSGGTVSFAYAPSGTQYGRTYTATITPPNGLTVTGYAWDFGDSQTANGASTSLTDVRSHTYAGSGSFTVSLAVTLSDGSTWRASRDVTLFPPTARTLSINPVSAKVPIYHNQGEFSYTSVYTPASAGAALLIGGEHLNNYPPSSTDPLNAGDYQDRQGYVGFDLGGLPLNATLTGATISGTMGASGTDNSRLATVLYIRRFLSNIPKNYPNVAMGPPDGWTQADGNSVSLASPAVSPAAFTFALPIGQLQPSDVNYLSFSVPSSGFTDRTQGMLVLTSLVLTLTYTTPN